MNISQALPMSLFLAYVLVAGSVKGAYSAPEEDGLQRRELASPSSSTNRGNNGKIHLRRTALKGQAAVPPSVEDGTNGANGAIRKGTGSVRQRKLTKISETELRLISSKHSSGDWENTVEQMANMLKLAKKRKYKDECGIACKQCWNALGGQIGGIDDVIYNLQRATHLESGAWKRISFCSENIDLLDAAACKSAFDFITTPNSGLMPLSQTKSVSTLEPGLCVAKGAEPNAYVLDILKQDNDDTQRMAYSLATCKDDAITLNVDFRERCAVAFDYLGGEMKSVKESLDDAMELFQEKDASDHKYGLMFCPNGVPKNLVKIRFVLQAFEYLSMTNLNEAHADGDVAEYPWMSYWQDYGRTLLNGPRTMRCE